MRCHKAQRLMNDKSFAANIDLVNLELAEHLRNCRSCASHTAAGELLNRAISLERVKSPEAETPLSFLKTRIEAQASQKNLKEHMAMASLKDKILKHPVMSFGFLGAVLMLFLMAIIPVSCSQDVGYSMNVGDDQNPLANAITSDADGTASITFQRTADNTHMLTLNTQNMIKALHAIGINDAKLQITANSTGETINISGLQSREQARQALLAVVEASGLGGGKVEITPREASVSGSLLDQCLSGIRELVFNSDGKTDEEVKNEITAALEAAGVSGANVQYQTDTNGHKMVLVGQGGEGDSVQIEQAFKWNVDSNGVTIQGNGEGDSNMVIDIQTSGDGQNVKVEKKVTVQTAPH